MERWLYTTIGRHALHIATLVLFLCISAVCSFPTAALRNAAAAANISTNFNKTRNSLLLQTLKSHRAHLNHDLSPSSSNTSISDITRKLLDMKFNFTLPAALERDSRYYNHTSGETRRYKRGSHRSHERFYWSSIPKLKQLYCRTGYRLAVYANGTINGTKRIDNPYSLMQISAKSFGVVHIRGVYSKLYVCMDENGELYGAEDANNDCLFEERLLSNWYTTFSSRTHPIRRNRRKWYLSLNKDGSSRNGARTKAKHNMAQFLPI